MNYSKEEIKEMVEMEYSQVIPISAIKPYSFSLSIYDSTKETILQQLPILDGDVVYFGNVSISSYLAPGFAYCHLKPQGVFAGFKFNSFYATLDGVSNQTFSTENPIFFNGISSDNSCVQFVGYKIQLN